MPIKSALHLQLNEWLLGQQLKACLRSASPAVWAATWEQLTYQPTAYCGRMIDYQHAYFSGAAWDLVDASLILLSDGKPCGLLPLTLRGGDSPSLTSQGVAILAPIFLPATPARTIKKIVAWVFDFLRQAHLKLGLTSMQCEQASEIWQADGCTDWHQLHMTNGAALTVQHDLYVKLTWPMEEIRAAFRKSYRPLISSGNKLWQTTLMNRNHLSAEIWTEFRLLHQEVAGRVTRSLESWQAQFDMIAAGQAFLVVLRDPATQRMVGGGFFQTTRQECVYAVGAYDRNLFDKPLGHVVQYAAIEEMRHQGLQWYKIGLRCYPQDTPAPSPKEVAIAEFKQGFSSHCFPRFTFTHDFSHAPART